MAPTATKKPTLRRASYKSCNSFQEKFLTEANIAELKFWNEEDCGGKWEYEHLLAGFVAATAPDYVEGVTPYYDNDDAITMRGYSRLLIMKQASA